MNLQSIGACILGAMTIVAGATPSFAQASGAHASAASRVSAEMTKGKLSPAESKPGDTVSLKFQDDVKANGQVVLKKGTAFTGVVRTVKRAEANSAQSMLEVEWLVPAGQGKIAQNVSVTLQSVMQTSPIFKQEPASAAEDRLTAGAVSPLTAAFPSTRTPNHALLSMPSVVAVDNRTGAEIEAGLGESVSSPLYKVGQGQLMTTSGSRQSVEIYSHLDNDTVITSQSKDFEISSGAQVKLLVGVNRK